MIQLPGKIPKAAAYFEEIAAAGSNWWNIVGILWQCSAVATVGSRISGTRIMGEFWIFLNFFFANHPRIHPWVNSRKKIGHARSTPPMGGDRRVRLSKWSLKLGSSGFLWESFYDLQNYSDYFLSTPALPRPQGRQWVGLTLSLWSLKLESSGFLYRHMYNL